jgi:hypothetical protein
MSSDSETPEGNRDKPGVPLEISLEAVPSSLKKTGGGEIHFARAVLVMKNTGSETLYGLSPHAALGQEGGVSQEVTETLTRNLPEQTLPPRGTVTWDLFDLLAAGHPGVASKVHLFGYKAVLNWWFDLAVRADYRKREGASPLQTPLFRARFRWNAQPGALDQVDLSIERR